MDKDSMDSMDSDSMVGRLGRMDKLGKMGIDNVDILHDVCHNRVHSHHRACHVYRNQIVSLFFPPFEYGLGYAM